MTKTFVPVVLSVENNEEGDICDVSAAQITIPSVKKQLTALTLTKQIAYSAGYDVLETAAVACTEGVCNEYLSA